MKKAARRMPRGFFPESRSPRSIVVVAFATTLGGGESRCKGAAQHGGSHPKRDFGGSLPRLVGGILRLCDHVVDALFGLILRKAGACSDALRHIGAIGSAEATRSGP